MISTLDTDFVTYANARLERLERLERARSVASDHFNDVLEAAR